MYDLGTSHKLTRLLKNREPELLFYSILAAQVYVSSSCLALYLHGKMLILDAFMIADFTVVK